MKLAGAETTIPPADSPIEAPTMPSEDLNQASGTVSRRISAYATAIDLAILLFALVISLAALWLPFGRSMPDRISPALLQSLQIAGIGAEHVLDGRVPLWNAHAFGGFPFHASGVAGVFYPANLLFAGNNLFVALQIDLLIHALIAGVGAYVLARQLFGTRIPALLVGIATVCTLPTVKLLAGEPISTLHAFAYLPWLVVCCRRAATTGGLLWGLMAAGVVAAQILTGAFQFALISTAFSAAYVVFEGLRRYFAEWEPLGKVLRRSAVALVGIVLGFALAGVQVVPSLELFSNSNGSHNRITASEPDSENYAHRIVIPSLDETPEASSIPTIEVGGLFLVVFALFGLSRSPVREKWTIAALTLIGYLFASGELTNLQLYPQILSLPFFSAASAFREVGTAANLFFILLAGGGAAAIERAGTGLVRARFVWPLCAVLAATAAWSVWFADWTMPSSRWTALALVAMGLIALLLPRQRVFAIGAWLAGALLFDLSNAVEAAVPTPALRTHSNLYGERNEFRQIALEHKGSGRMALLPVKFDPADTHLYDGMLAGERTLPLFSSSTATFMGDAWSASVERVGTMWRFPDAEFDGKTAEREGVHSSIVFLRALNVEYIVSPKPGPAVINQLCDLSQDLFMRHELPNSIIYKLVDASPAAYILHELEVRKPSATFAGRIADFDFDWRTTVLVERALDFAEDRAPTEDEGIVVKRYEDELVEIELFVNSPGILVLTDSYYPGWRATFADGTEREVIRVNEFLRGVEVRPGDSSVVFSYRPTSLAVGRRVSLGAAAVSVVLVSILAVAGIVAWRKSKRT